MHGSETEWKSSSLKHSLDDLRSWHFFSIYFTCALHLQKKWIQSYKILFTNENLSLFVAGEQTDDEPPPEPAPPEVPPRAHSLLTTIKKGSTQTIRIDETGDLKHEQFIPANQQQGNSHL